MTISSEFIRQMKRLMPSECDALIEAITTTSPPVSLRINDAKAALLALQAPSARSRVPWCPLGAYLNGRQPFTFDPDFQTGRYYVQDASSMFIYHAIQSLVKTPARYLDLCAAPGGKTTAALSALPAGSMVVANEIVPQRARILLENVTKWGNPRCVVTSNSSKEMGRLAHFFDLVAIDAPCSGEGMMRKDEEAVAQWSPALVRQCAELQHRIIDEAWSALKPGGLLIYSTCTYNRQENEDVVEYIISQYHAQSVEVPTEGEWNIWHGIGTDAHCYRFLPHRTMGEGLFMAVLQKPEDEPLRPSKRKKGKSEKQLPLPRGIENWLKTPGDFDLQLAQGRIVACPHDMSSDLQLISATLNVLHQGITLGAVKGRNCIPSHSLALSTQLNGNAFARCEIDYRTALAYLRGEAITVRAPKGYTLLTHASNPIGFVNNLGSHANNLYPKPWRILSTHLPAQEPRLLRSPMEQ